MKYLEKIHNNYGKILFVQKRYDEAIQQFKAALKINSYYSYSHYNLYRTYKEMGEIEKSLNYYANAKKLNYKTIIEDPDMEMEKILELLK